MKQKIWPVLAGIALVLAVAFYLYPVFYVPPVLMYHSINYARDERSRANTVSPETFERQMAFLKKHNYRVLSLDEYYEGIRAKTNFCCRTVVLTFDDGLEDNYSRALPILKKFNFPAAYFLMTAKIGEKTYMTKEQVKEAQAAGVTIGSHMINEIYLPDLSLAEQEHEIVGSKKDLELMFGKPVFYLAYPIGGYSKEIKTFATQAGYRMGFTTNRGKDRFNRDLLELKRIRPKDSDSDLIFLSKLSGYYNFFRKSKNPH